MFDHVRSALVPLLAFTAVPSILSDDLSDSPRFINMPSPPDDKSAERSDSFYRPAMTPEEKEAFYRPIVRSTAKDGKVHIRCSSTDTMLEHSHKNRGNRPRRKKSGTRSKSESRRQHVCRHRKSKSDQIDNSTSNWVRDSDQNQRNQHAPDALPHDESTVTDSGYHQTSTDGSQVLAQQKWNELQMLRSKFQELEAERNALQDALADALAQLQDTQTDNAQVLNLRRQNKQLQEDVLLLKGAVYRLNAELEKYQNRLRALKKASGAAAITVEEPAVVSHVKPTPMASNMLGPLLEAYQETIHEKETALENSNKDLAAYAQQCHAAKRETQILKKKLEDAISKNGELTDLQIQLEEAHQRSDTLLQSLEEERSHLRGMQRKHQQEVSALDERARGLEGKLTECQSELLMLRGRYSVLAEQYDRLQQGADRLIPLSVHNSAVNECKRLFEELKSHYEMERDRFVKKIATLEVDKPRLEAALETQTANHSSVEGTNRALEKLLKNCQLKNEELCARLVTAHVDRDSAKRQLHRSLTLVRELVSEQEHLVRALQERQHESQSVAKMGSTLVARVGSLKAQMESVQRGAYEELGTVEKLMRERAAGAARAEQQYQQEVQQLRSLLHQKEQFIARLQRDKNKTEESLEIVWKAATSEKPTLRETLVGNILDKDPTAFQAASHFQEMT